MEALAVIIPLQMLLVFASAALVGSAHVLRSASARMALAWLVGALGFICFVSSGVWVTFVERSLWAVVAPAAIAGLLLLLLRLASSTGGRVHPPRPNPSIERTSYRRLRRRQATAHLER
jgi:hypothetical protein